MGDWEYMVKPFRLINAPAVFQALVNDVPLSGKGGEGFCPGDHPPRFLYGVAVTWRIEEEVYAA